MKQIFSKGVLLALGVCAVMNLSSCKEDVMDEGFSGNPMNEGAQLTLTTRGDGDPEESVIKESRSYFFNEANKCVQILTTNEDDNSFTVRLGAGTYTVLSVGGNDLSRFNLPIQSGAADNSVITLKDGQEMGDLLMKRSTVTIVKGQDVSETITLERKVIQISDIEIKEVPDDVTGVSVTLSDFYGAVYLDGTFPNSPTTDYTVALTEQEDGTTWKATPDKLAFPSAGTPSIMVELTKADGTDIYSYSLAEELTCNKHYSFSGTYKNSLGKLTATITAQEWGENKSSSFDFDEGNMAFSNLVAGKFCNGYYVVSVNASAGTAVLLAKGKLVYNAPASGSDATVWQEALNGPMAALDKPIGITNNWRLPTTAEAEIFTKDTQIVDFDASGYSALFFCTEESVLKAGWTTRSGDTYTFHKGSSGYNSTIQLRPVIDINF